MSFIIAAVSGVNICWCGTGLGRLVVCIVVVVAVDCVDERVFAVMVTCSVCWVGGAG